MAPLALVHGNPETPAVWDHLAPSLEAAGRDPVRLAPPGFGAAVPPASRPLRPDTGTGSSVSLSASASRLTSSGTTGEACSCS
jgi:pimeloyl-ACP methyl ester carboxylesterase